MFHWLGPGEVTDVLRYEMTSSRYYAPETMYSCDPELTIQAMQANEAEVEFGCQRFFFGD